MDRSLFIERGGGLVQKRGGSPFFMQKLSGGHKKTCKRISQKNVELHPYN